MLLIRNKFGEITGNTCFPDVFSKSVMLYISFSQKMASVLLLKYIKKMDNNKVCPKKHNIIIHI